MEGIMESLASLERWWPAGKGGWVGVPGVIVN